jgi:hypothetical protein
MVLRCFYPFHVYLCVLFIVIISIPVSAAQTEIPRQVLDLQKAAQENVSQAKNTLIAAVLQLLVGLIMR